MASMARLLSFVVLIAVFVVYAQAECQKFCTMDWNPVCARNYNGEFHTFGNPCEYEATQCENPAAGWIRTRDGEC